MAAAAAAAERLSWWERPERPLAPLSERQRDSVLELRGASPGLPLPPEVGRPLPRELPRGAARVGRAGLPWQVVWAGGKETTRKPRGRGGSGALGDEREGCLGRGSFGAPLLPPPPMRGLGVLLQTSLPPARQKPRGNLLEMSEVRLALFGRARRRGGGFAGESNSAWRS